MLFCPFVCPRGGHLSSLLTLEFPRYITLHFRRVCCHISDGSNKVSSCQRSFQKLDQDAAFHPPIKTSPVWAFLACELELQAREEAREDHRSPSLLSSVEAAGGGCHRGSRSGPAPRLQLAPRLKESRIARRPEARRCPLALLCHSRERPLQRDGQMVGTETARRRHPVTAYFNIGERTAMCDVAKNVGNSDR